MLLVEIVQKIADVWKQWKQENPHLTDPTVVNNGYCAEFAIEVGAVVPNIIYWSNHDKNFEHVFLQHAGKFYDAECLMGVPDYKQMPIWQRIAHLHNEAIEDVTRGCRPVSLQELCRQYNFQYPPTK